VRGLLQQAGFRYASRLVPVVLLALSGKVVAQPASFYEFTQTAYVDSAPSRDGIGKRYMGREISHVMGHQGAAWLERDEREREEGTDILIAELGLRDTDVVADIGAGTGYFVFLMSPLVAKGKVLAVDIQPEMLDIIAQRAAGVADNVEPVLGSITDINVPEDSVDLILLVDAYHEFSHPREMVQSMFRALKPGGRLALVEYRAEDPSVPIKPLHKMSEAQAIREMSALGLQWMETRHSLPQQHLMFFVKPQSDAQAVNALNRDTNNDSAATTGRT
jgi:ubiquinone/menaquinone biosynthesis C-methylase UbiE